MSAPSANQRLTQVIFWLALCIILGGSVALDLIVAPTVFATVRQLDVQIPHLPATIIAPNYVGGKTFGNVIMRFQYVQFVCFVILMFIIALQSYKWLDGKRFWVLTRWFLIGLAFIALLLGMSATAYIVSFTNFWVLSTSSGDLMFAKVARQNLDWWHAAAEKIEMAKLLALIFVAAISAWACRQRPTNPN